MNNVIELEPILAKVNQKLPRKHHINNEDPIIGLIFLNIIFFLIDNNMG